MKSMKWVLLLLCALVAGGSGSALANPANPDPRTMTFPPLKFEIPKSERVTLKNGIVVYLLQDHELPLVNITAYVNAGNLYDPADKVGLAMLTGAVLRSGGTATIAPEKLDSELEYMASAIESGASTDMATVGATTLTRNLERTLELFAQLLREPAFHKGRLEIARKQAIEAVRRQYDNPKAVGDRELRRAIYPGHPLGRFPTRAGLQRITREDVIAFHKRYYIPANTMLAISGDFDKEGMVARLNALLGSWPQRSPSLPRLAEPREVASSEVLLVHKGVNQSVIRMGHLGIEKNNPDLHAIKVMDYILGGGFTSRLTREIRSNQGLAYNVESNFETGRRFPGVFVAETETKSQSTGRAIELLNSIIGGMTSSEVTDQELKLAKDSIINSFIFGFTKPEAIVTQQARLEFFGYPPDYLEKFRERIAAVTKEDVLRVARKYLHTGAIKIVVVGDPQKFDRPLAGFGTVRQIKPQF